MIEMLFENGSTYMMSTLEYRLLIFLALVGAAVLWSLFVVFIFNMYNKFKRRFRIVTKRKKCNLNIE